MFALSGSSKDKILFGKHVKEKGKKIVVFRMCLEISKPMLQGKDLTWIWQRRTHLFPTEIYVDSEYQTKDLSSDTRTY